MKLKNVAQSWEEFVSECFLESVPENQLKDMRMAYYFGCLNTIKLVLDNAYDANVSEKVFHEFQEQWLKDVIDYLDSQIMTLN